MKRIIGVDEKVSPKMLIPLSIQHTFAMFGASVLVPIVLGINPSIVLLMNGIGTLLFILITKRKAPAYLGSSFAFLGPATIIIGQSGFRYAQGAFVAIGLIGKIGANIMTDTRTTNDVIVFLVTLSVAILGSVLFKKFLATIPILIAIITGYIVSVALKMVDFTPVMQASLFTLPKFQLPIFDLKSIITMLPVILVITSEHISHQVVTSNIIGRDLLKEPGLHRSIFADNFSTAISGFIGGVPTTTYGENIGVMAITKVYSVYVIAGAACISILMAFIGPLSALISSIPGNVIGGVTFLLYGMIGTSGIRLLVDQKVDYSQSKNLILTSVIFVTGLSGLKINFLGVSLSGMVLASVVAVVLSLLFYVFDRLGIMND